MQKFPPISYCLKNVLFIPGKWACQQCPYQNPSEENVCRRRFQMFEERRQLRKVSWSAAQPLPVNIPCSDNWKYHWLRIVATCILTSNKNVNLAKIMAATPSILGWPFLRWKIPLQRFTQAKMSREEILADFQVFLATDKDILYSRFSTYLIAASPCLKYIIWHSQVPE